MKVFARSGVGRYVGEDHLALDYSPEHVAD